MSLTVARAFSHWQALNFASVLGKKKEREVIFFFFIFFWGGGGARNKEKEV